MKRTLNSYAIMSFMLALLFTLSTQTSFAQTIHAIIVIEAEDGIGSAKDKVRINAELNQIHEVTGMNVRKHEFDRNDPQIGSTLRDLQVEEDDVVWFYYSGHGQNAGDGWPMFFNQQRYKITKVREILKGKDCRLKLVMYDCCNHGATVAAYRKSPPGVPSSAYEFLFKKSKGNVMACSSVAGNYSYGTPEIGGFFTDAFFKSIQQVSYSSTEDQQNIWKNTLNKTIELTNELCNGNGMRSQTPKFIIDVEDFEVGENNAPQAAPTYVNPESLTDF